MNEKRVAVLLVGILMFSLFLSVEASAFQIRPANQINHPGLSNPYNPPAEGPNHRGVSDYTNKWLGISELCESEWQIRPANQGKNIMRFFSCFCGD